MNRWTSINIISYIGTFVAGVLVIILRNMLGVEPFSVLELSLMVIGAVTQMACSILMGYKENKWKALGLIFGLLWAHFIVGLNLAGLAVLLHLLHQA